VKLQEAISTSLAYNCSSYSTCTDFTNGVNMLLGSRSCCKTNLKTMELYS